MFTLAYHGNGGWSWNNAFSLPIHIRRYCLNMIRKAKEDEKESIERQNTQKQTIENSTPKIPDVVKKNIQRRKPPKKD